MSAMSRTLGLSALIAACAFASAGAQDGALGSFRSSNYPYHYMRHRSSLGYLDRVVARDKLGRRDATFRLVPGLAGKCRSFESVNYPGHFLRHQNYRLKLAARSEDQLFKQDATFCFKPGMSGSGGYSFESINFPGHYIRHTNFDLWLARSDGSALFREDATFYQSPALTTHEPAVPID
jgi:hypothetical protein